MKRLIAALAVAIVLLGTGRVRGQLWISEIMYHAYEPTTDELAVNPAFTHNDFDFIELWNSSSEPIDLDGIRFISGIDFDFTGGSVETLAGGAYVVLAQDEDCTYPQPGTAMMQRGCCCLT